jgi:hypothetical protein
VGDGRSDAVHFSVVAEAFQKHKCEQTFDLERHVSVLIPSVRNSSCYHSSRWEDVPMSDKPQSDESDKPSVTLPGTVEKIIKPVLPDEPEKAQIAIEGADDLYREIRIDNKLQNEKGEDVSLKPGAQVEVTVEAEPKGTTPKKTA